MINKCYKFNIDTYRDERGSLSFLENASLPFDFKRIYYLYHTRDKCIRGVHAHKNLEQILIAFSGVFEVMLDDGIDKKVFTLDRPDVGLYVCPMIWREVTPIGNDGVFTVLASRLFEKEDYIHEYSDFLSRI